MRASERCYAISDALLLHSGWDVSLLPSLATGSPSRFSCCAAWIVVRRGGISVPPLRRTAACSHRSARDLHAATARGTQSATHCGVRLSPPHNLRTISTFFAQMRQTPPASGGTFLYKCRNLSKERCTSGHENGLKAHARLDAAERKSLLPQIKGVAHASTAMD